MVFLRNTRRYAVRLDGRPANGAAVGTCYPFLPRLLVAASSLARFL